ncbi:MAG TPA: 2-oxoacid:ferredoxin oxidoreductase subunit beta [Bacteroidota bacterium]|mgnify:FL=1|jgi:2-oxoglutarate ferredoxin oxidoreductase subunit beta|nr:2-oxoacid:ferredoxin oxidoreductase subunit beta [Bacteroidota bacterium]
MEQLTIKYTAKDFASDQDVRWCPGCGDYSILAQVQRTLPELNIPKEKIVFVSGIGCSSRFPYYMNTYGFHGIHGRATAIASGLKVSRPDLSVWVATGDGDLLSIGGNHFIHVLRRNIDMNILLFNNKIYGLTKGQYSPTSEHGKKTKSSPFGVIDHPFNPILLALGAEGTFIARSIDREPKHLQEMIYRAAKHKGTSFIEIFQNCNIFNDGAYDHLTDKEVKDENVVVIEHNKPLVFGKKRNKGIKLDGFNPKVINFDDGKNSINDCLIYDETNNDLAYIVARLTDNPSFPTPIGVFLSVERSTYDEEMVQQIEGAKKKLGVGDLNKLFNSGNVWEVS